MFLSGWKALLRNLYCQCVVLLFQEAFYLLFERYFTSSSVQDGTHFTAPLILKSPNSVWPCSGVKNGMRRSIQLFRSCSTAWLWLLRTFKLLLTFGWTRVSPECGEQYLVGSFCGTYRRKNGASCRNIHISIDMKQSANYNMATWCSPTAIYRFLALGPGINSVWLLQDAGGGCWEQRLVASAGQEHSIWLDW